MPKAKRLRLTYSHNKDLVALFIILQFLKAIIKITSSGLSKVLKLRSSGLKSLRVRKRDFRFAGGGSQVIELTILKYTLVDFVRDCRTGYHYEQL